MKVPRKQKADALRQLVKLLLELADVQDFNDGLFEAIDAWEREPELLRIILEYSRCGDTLHTKRKSMEILHSTGYIKVDLRKVANNGN